ncbi:hypothetical protein [Mucilaginibacter sp. KACC 22063]|uniref:hypothetical protein n=1 Tax=Mucilaginibacter sp. KACC 22063 TaxID=3025666 RepID=UPI0023651556|nr:hypothetical protein [Mucilaginibacter sp. KACC 22063]WDF55099.1 hypothetical protein PQ461_19400 [Mucilaginibacter sp. KACC 22063]
MKKYLFSLTIIAFCFKLNTAKAQFSVATKKENTWHLEVGANGLYDLNPGKKYYTAGFGAQLAGIYYPNEFVGITLTTGYFDLPGKKRTVNRTEIKQPNFQFVPLKLGVRGFFVPKWYLAGEFGLGYATPDIGNNTHFAKTIAPGLGYEDLDSGLDVSLRYENMHHQGNYVSMIALQVAYSINLSK